MLTQVEAFEPDWGLVLPYVPDEARGGWLAVLGYAAEVIGAPARVSNGMLGRIRLQWWREALDEVFGDGSVREHPVVRAMAVTLRQSSDVRQSLEAMADGMEGFLSNGADNSIDTAVAARQSVYGGLAEALGALAGCPSGGEGLTLYALARSAPDADAIPGEDGTEPPARRFSRALGQDHSLEPALAERIVGYRKERGDKVLALPALPLVLAKAKGGKVSRVKNPLAQKLAVFRGVLMGRV
nr:squalene/phytoene synthase family protein [Parvularcula mediterranea]